MKAPIAIALQTAGLLSALVFLIHSISDVLAVNRLYESQHILIVLLLITLSLWALLEITLLRHLHHIALCPLEVLLGVQLVLVLSRHGHDLLPPTPATESLGSATPEVGEALLFLPIHLVLFLAISKYLINAFAYAERLRASQLRQQMFTLQCTKDALEESEKRYRLMAQNVDDVIWTVDTTGSCTFISPSLQQLSGHAPDELIGRPLSLLCSPESAEILLQAMQHGLQQARQGNNITPFRAELKQKHLDGSLIWTEITMNGLHCDDGALTGFVGVTRDIRNRKLYELNLRGARDAAEEANLALLSANARLHGLATTDMLTGLANRSHFKEAVSRQMEQSRLHGDRLALLMLDLDNFKTINDRYGHSLGDIILVEMSRLLKASLRKHDLLARWGGDEFILTLPRTNATQALQFADQLRLQCSVHPFPAVRTITLCIGVAELGSDETLRQWLNRADTMLGTAKNAGRNTVKLSI